MPEVKITILGAGSVGCYVGGKLALHQSSVHFIGRKKTGEQVKSNGFVVSDQDGNRQILPPAQIAWSQGADFLTHADIILLCVKSADTQSAARLISTACKNSAIIISLQNGVGNVDILQKLLPTQLVLAGMVSFNIVRFDEKQMRFHRGTDGEIVIEDHERSRNFVQLLKGAGVSARGSKNMREVMWGKLLFNLNNAVNVLSGIPLKEQLRDKNYRAVFSASVAEALKVMRAAGITPAKTGKVTPSLIPVVLNLPNPVFRVLARGMLKMDDSARSSMWEDLQAGRQSEIEFLNGAICKTGARFNVATPVNDRLMELVSEIFAGPAGIHSSGKTISGKKLYSLIIGP